MKMRVFAVALMAAVLATATLRAAQLPPIVWTCPMHPDVIEDKKGKCPICRMDLEAVRLVAVWKCPVHAVIEQNSPGKCRICGRDLVSTTMAMTWTCTSNKQVSQLEPGTCGDGTPMVAHYTPRPHGDHNPKHGGIFFMAPDNWHHIEGTYPAAGRFRVYVYDDFSKPLATDKARSVRARVVTKEQFDPATKTTRELSTAPLVLARNGAFFEARIDPLAMPAKMTAKISFTRADKESRFDFVFPAYSKDEPARIAPTTSTSRTPSPAPSIGAPASAATASLVADLKKRELEVGELVKNGNFGGVYVPALQAKDLALEIQTRSTDGERVETPVRQLVVYAYQLDNYGDLGDSEKIHEAYRNFSAAVAALEAALAHR